MRAEMERSCIHTVTTKPWTVETAIEKYASAGIAGITLWRDAYSGRSLPALRRKIADASLAVVSVCRGGFFASAEATSRASAVEDNRRAVDEAAALGAPHVVLVCGADPRQSLEDSRAQIRDGILAVLPHAEASGVKLAVEPLHPMYADTRSAINTLRQANDLVESVGSAALGVAIDAYHLWWDPELESQIERTGRLGALLAFHVSDWMSPTGDLLNDRGLMGEGCIDLPRIRVWVERTRWRGFIEVEIFSDTYWKGDQDEFLTRIVEAYRNCV